MFKLKLEGGQCKCTAYFSRDELKFDPPVYEQRYMAVLRVLEHYLWEGKLKKITEFGCAEMKFFNLLKKVKGVEHILQIDIDGDTLSDCKRRTDPLLVDYLKQRETPLRVDIYHGSISVPHEFLINSDAVIAIELIEHLHADVLEEVPYNIFGYIKPKLAIFTTPNSEFNVLFNSQHPNGFRHPDHKFEWNRNEFQDWCLNICQRFPNYKVAIVGIGNGPPDKRDVGCVTQMGVFVRKDILGESLPEDINPPHIETPVEDYHLVHTVEYPYHKDDRTQEEKLLDDVKYHIGRYTYGDRWLNLDQDMYEIPLHMLYSILFPKVLSITELADFLTSNGYTVERELVLVKPVEEECNSEDQSDMDVMDGDEMDIKDMLDTVEIDEEDWD